VSPFASQPAAALKTFGLSEVLRPIGCDAALRFFKRHIAGSYLCRQVALYSIFALEVAISQSILIRAALGPDVAQPVLSSEFERHEVI
jgi:hypothetical protein